MKRIRSSFLFSVWVLMGMNGTHSRALIRLLSIPFLTAAVVGGFAQRESNEAEWGARLTSFLQGSGAAVLIDLPTFGPPPQLAASAPIDMAALKRLSFILQRDLAAIPGALVFRRQRPHDPARFGEETAASLTEWLLGASSDELRKAFGNGVYFYELSDEGRRAAGLLANSRNGLMSAIASGDPLQVSVRIAPDLVFFDDRTGKAVRFGAETVAVPMPDPDRRAPDPASETLPQPEEGDLDYEDGKVVTLEQLIAEVRATYRLNVVADERILSTQLYVRGRFSRDSIREALSLIAAVYPSQVGEWRRDDRIAALQQLFEGDLEDVADSALPCGYSGRELLEGVEGTIGEFAERFPLVAEFMSKNGLDPDMRAKLDVSIVVSLGGHGSSISRHGRAFRDGIEVPAYEANRVSFAIRR